ncbi:hypothetical protein [Aeromonas veronii]|uniref:hypothetical protein n=1 Tax=Aeromonas veronii TaxID=654 RepID=UPI00366C02BF
MGFSIKKAFKTSLNPFKQLKKDMNRITKWLGLNPKVPEAEKRQDEGFELSTEGATRGIGMIYGKTRVQTSVTFHDVSNDQSTIAAGSIAGLTGRALEQRLVELRRIGAPATAEGQWLCTVATIGHGPINGIKQIYFGGEPILKDRDIQLTEHGYVPADYILDKFKKQGIIIQYKTGKQDYFFNEVAARCPDYKGKMMGYGMAALAICIARDPENGEIQSEPEIDVEVEGRFVLDKRTNQRVYSTNPAMCIRDYIQSDFGFQIPEHKIDDNEFIKFANYCDRIYPAGMNGFVDTSKTSKSNLERMQADFQCSVVRIGDMWSVVYNAPCAAVCTVTEDDIISAVVMDAAPTEAEFNELEVEYKDAAKNYQKDILRYPSATRDELIARYGKVINKKVQADFTTSKAQVDKIASTMFEMTRGVRIVRFTGSAKVYALNIGDVVNLKHPLLGTTSAVPFRVNTLNRGLTDEHLGTAEVELMEYKPNSFDTVYISNESQYKPDPIRKVNAPSLLQFKITDVGYTLTGLLEWMPAVCGDFRDYVVQRRFHGATEWEPQGSVKTPYMYLNSMPHGNYDFRVFTRTKYNEYSEPCTISDIDVSDDTVLPTVQGLRLVTLDKDSTVSTGINFELVWDSMSEEVVKADTQVYKTDKVLKVKDVIRSYEVTIFHGANKGKKVQTIEVQEPNFTYTLEQNAANGLSRYCSFEVRIVSKGGARSQTAAVIQCKNTQCKQPTGIKANSSVSGIQIEWDRCTELDFQGTRVYLSQTKGFTCSDANLALNGDVRNNFYYKPETDGKWYGRIAHYDKYGLDEQVYSPEMELFAQSIENLMEQKDSAVMKQIHEDIAGVVAGTDNKILATKDELNKSLTDAKKTLSDADAKMQKAFDEADKALIKRIDTLDTAYKQADTEQRAQVQTQVGVLTDADSALGKRIDALEVSTTEADKQTKARIDSIQQAYTSADTALGKRIDTLKAESTKGDEKLQAQVDTANTAISDNAKATAESMKNTKAELQKAITEGDAKGAEALNAAVTSLEQAYTKADTAMATTVQTVKADLTKLINEGDAKNTKDMQAAITETKTALVEGDKLIAKSIQDVSTKVQGVEGKVQTQQQVIQDINGNLTAKYVTSVNANGVFGGFELYGDAKTKTTKFAVETDDFVVVNPNDDGSKAVAFEVRNGKPMAVNAMIGDLDASNIRAGGINAACIQAGSITAEKIAAGSITGDKIVANVQLQTPDLFMGDIRLNAGAAGFGRGKGPYGGWDSTWSTIIYADGTLCTNKINASAGTISNLNVQNCTIAQDCKVLGTLYADNIVGLPSGKSFGHGEFGVPRDGNWMTIAEHQIRSPQGRFNTNCQIVIRGAAGAYSGGMYGASFGSYIGIRVLLNGSQIYAEMITQTPNTGSEFHTQGYSWASPPFNIGSNGGYMVVQITTVNWWKYTNSGVQYNWAANKNGNRDYNILSSSMQGYIYSAIDK